MNRQIVINGKERNCEDINNSKLILNMTTDINSNENIIINIPNVFEIDIRHFVSYLKTKYRANYVGLFILDKSSDEYIKLDKLLYLTDFFQLDENIRKELVNIILLTDFDIDLYAKFYALSTTVIKTEALLNARDDLYGDIDAMKSLLKDDRVDITIKNNEIIRKAASYGYTEVVKLLLEDGRSDPTSKCNYALIHAIRNNSKDIVKLLIEDGRIIIDYDDCAIHNATYYGYREIQKILQNHFN